MSVRACALVATPAGWPVVRVLRLDHPGAACQDDATRRVHARQRVRDALVLHADPAVVADFLGAPRALRGAGRVSVSHEVGVSLVAWCEQGCVGIDIVDVAHAVALDGSDVATLYLGADAGASIGMDRERFAHAWAKHEARLKCLGLELTEWDALPHVTLTACEVAEVGLDDPGKVAWVAWAATVPRHEGLRQAQPERE